MPGAASSQGASGLRLGGVGRPPLSHGESATSGWPILSTAYAVMVGRAGLRPATGDHGQRRTG